MQRRFYSLVAPMAFLSTFLMRRTSNAATFTYHARRRVPPATAHDAMVAMTPTTATTRNHSHGALSSQSDVLDPLIVCGPSGVGKGTIIHKYMTERGGADRFGFTVSHTTRAPRPGETDGIHYHFCSPERMKELLAQNAFVESAHVHGNMYGTSWEELRAVHASGKRCLLDIDTRGVQSIKNMQRPGVLEPRYVFIAPPSMVILRERLTLRNTESVESLQIRLQNAQAEVDYGEKAGNFDAIIVNDNLEEAVVDFERVVADMFTS